MSFHIDWLWISTKCYTNMDAREVIFCIYCRMPGKWGLQKTHYSPEQTGQTNPLARLRWTFPSKTNIWACKRLKMSKKRRLNMYKNT